MSLRFHIIDALLDFVIAGLVFRKLPVVLVLIHCRGGVHGYEPLHQATGHFQLCLQLCFLIFQARNIAALIHDFLAQPDDLILVFQQLVDRHDSPAFREIGEAVGLRSSATISRYIHRLIDDGRISIEESKPRTLSAKNSGAAFETVHQRVCLTLADGGKIYMDCNLRKPRAASIKLTFDGILDAKAMKGRIERIVSCNMSYE